VIHVPYRPDVHVRLTSIKFLFAHLCLFLTLPVVSASL
jgi:hypothetical protein